MQLASFRRLVSRLPVMRTPAQFTQNLMGAASRALCRPFPIGNLEKFEQRFSSQHGEDGILVTIFSRIGSTNRFFVEFGVQDGVECNSRHLRERMGWSGLLMDGGEHLQPCGPVQREFVTAENITALLDKYAVPREFDLLSIDIDGNDYWVWRAIQGYSPRAVVIEYNASVPPTESRTIVYKPDFRWDGSNYYGAGLLALERLGRRKGYRLVGCDGSGVNAFFVREDLCGHKFGQIDVESHYRPPRFGIYSDGRYHGFPNGDARPWMSVES